MEKIAMPVINVHVLEGYDAATKQRIACGVTDAVRLVIAADSDLITVTLRDIPADNYFRGGVSRRPGPARPDPKELVRTFLASMERRDLQAAEELLADDFVMRFPGTVPMTRLRELIDWARPRYNYVTKSYAGFEALQGMGEEAIVYCRGTLSGEWPDGTPFDGIRFIDRFEIVGGRIARQDVWNDIAEVRAGHT